MNKSRLEAFSDGVLAIIITIMVLDLKVPHGNDISALTPVLSVFLSYILSFIYIGIYWNNHHHMMHTVNKVNGKILLANLHLLFWLSLVPFVTEWLGENRFAAAPTALYGVILLMSAIAYIILQYTILCSEDKGSLLAKAIGKDIKGKISLLLYLLAIFLSYYVEFIAQFIYAIVALIWIIPDSRIEKTLNTYR